MRRGGRGGNDGGRRKGEMNPRRLPELQPIWGMLYADDAGIVPRSRNSLAKMVTDIVAVCDLFGLILKAKPKTVRVMTKRM